MNFFIPLDCNRPKAERLWRTARELLDEIGFPTRERRIHSLFYWRGDEQRVLQVGLDDALSAEPVLMIFHAANAPFYWVCTMLNGLVDGSPIAVPESEVVCVVGFDD
jgi:hypothetical protein